MEIANITMHEDWRSTDKSYDADIAILTFKTEVKLTDFVRTVCLPQSVHYNALQKGVVVGWGVSEKTDYKMSEPEPRKTEIKTPPSNAECFLKNPDLAKISSNRTYCAGGDSTGPCFGDSVNKIKLVCVISLFKIMIFRAVDFSLAEMEFGFYRV